MATTKTSAGFLRAFALFALLAFGLAQYSFAIERTHTAPVHWQSLQSLHHNAIKASDRIANALSRPELGNRAISLRAEIEPALPPHDGIVPGLPTFLLPIFVAQAATYFANWPSHAAFASTHGHPPRAPPRV